MPAAPLHRMLPAQEGCTLRTSERAADLRPLLAASRTVGRRLKRGDVVVYEFTVYPGATEMDCVPVLEAESGLSCGRDFTVGYSPERINPGDKEHRFETITKVVSGSDPKTRDLVAAVYGSVVTAGVPDIRNTRVVDIVAELRSFGVEVAVHDPMAAADEVAHEYGLALTPRGELPPANAVVLARPARRLPGGEGWGLVTGLLKDGRGLVMDVKGLLDRGAVPDGVDLWRL